MLDIQKWTNAQVRGIVSELAQALYEQTPVDTGWARSNWAIGPDVEETTVGSKEAVTDGRYLEGLAALQTADFAVTPRWYVSNPVPYLPRLNDGWSKQAPAGFVEAALAEATAHAEWPIKG